MKKLLFILPALLFLASCGQGRESKTIRIVNTDIEHECSIQPGMYLKFSLEANPTTGYSWVWTNEKDLPFLNKETETFINSDSPNKVGVPGKTEFTFKAASPGKGVIIMEYKRPWEKDTPPAKTEKITVEVK